MPDAHLSKSLSCSPKDAKKGEERKQRSRSQDDDLEPSAEKGGGTRPGRVAFRSSRNLLSRKAALGRFILHLTFSALVLKEVADNPVY